MMRGTRAHPHASQQARARAAVLEQAPQAAAVRGGHQHDATLRDGPRSLHLLRTGTDRIV